MLSMTGGNKRIYLSIQSQVTLNFLGHFSFKYIDFGTRKSNKQTHRLTANVCKNDCT